MAINFPDSPSNGDTFTANSIVYTYNASTSLWDTISASGSAIDLSAVDQAIIPDTDITYDLGSSTHKWKDLYLSGSTLHLGSNATIAAGAGSEIVLPSIKVGAGSNAVKLSASATGGLQTQAVVGGVSQPVQPAGGTVQVADLAAMQAIASPAIGNMVSVVANKTIYMYNGTGFYKIATMVNESPSAITGVNGSYALATDGTATTITAISTDPEGRTLSWSYAVTSGSLTNGGGATATVTQGTGSNTHIFTITPTTNSAYAGSFSITFSVTDNVNGAVNAVSAFTLAFIVQNSRYTALLVNATNTGSNQTFDDASTSNHTITANGNATASTFSPHRHGGYSAYFDGTGDYLTGPSSATIGIGTGDFTIECWFYATDGTSVDRGIWETRTDGYPNGADGLSLTRITETTFRVFGTSQIIVSSATTITNNWNHLAVVRNSGTLEFFVNGVSQGTASNSTNMNSSQPIAIGSGRYTTSNSTPTHAVKGYIQDFRVLTSALYTSNFTPPTAPVTAITNTKFLLGQLPYFKDQSASNHTITVGGNASLKPKSLFDNNPYSKASHGASVYFDGTGDYLSLSASNDFDVSDGDITIECWVYRSAADTTKQCVWEFYADDNNLLRLFYEGNNKYSLLQRVSGTDNFNVSISGTTSLNEWEHLAVTRSSSGTYKLYINGVENISQAEGVTINTSSMGFYIGADLYNTDRFWNGYISDFRIVKGSLVYSSNFTPPTAPLTAITNTKFLLNPETSISDLSQKHAIKCVADAATSTTQVKFAGTKSIYLDGTGDYISIKPMSEFGEKNWTFETWVYVTGTGTYHLFSRGPGNSTSVAALSINANGIPSVQLWDGSADRIISSGSTGDITANTWHHVVLTHTYTSSSSSTYKIWVDGSQVTSITHTGGYHWSWSSLSGTNLLLGAYGYNNGQTAEMYLQDSRLTIGPLRYTSTFTPPTAQLNG